MSLPAIDFTSAMLRRALPPTGCVRCAVIHLSCEMLMPGLMLRSSLLDMPIHPIQDGWMGGCMSTWPSLARLPGPRGCMLSSPGLEHRCGSLQRCSSVARLVIAGHDARSAAGLSWRGGNLNHIKSAAPFGSAGGHCWLATGCIAGLTEVLQCPPNT